MVFTVDHNIFAIMVYFRSDLINENYYWKYLGQWKYHQFLIL
jgi:hypothetical protein